MAVSKLGVCPEQELRQFSKSNWTELRFLPTPGLNKTIGSSGGYEIPFVNDWRFSPRGRLGVSIGEGNGTGFDVFLLDVHNHLWFGHSLTELNVKYKDIFTYYMLNENILIVVEILDIYLVKQHLILVDLETREAEFIQTVFHQFPFRVLTFKRHPWISKHGPSQHVPITVKEKDYTALVSSTNCINKKRFIYLVPRNPLNPDIQPMEFMISTELNQEDQLQIERLAGNFYHNCIFFYSAFSSANLLHFPPTVAFNYPTVTGVSIYTLLGVYLTVDVSKLINIYNIPEGPDTEQIHLDEQQAESMRLIIHPFNKIFVQNRVTFSCSTNGAVAYLMPWEWDQPTEPFNTTYHVLESMYTLKIETNAYSWLNMHPCGALLQFKVNPYTCQICVKVASVYNNTLESIANSKAIFHPNRPIGTIEGLHQMVFHGLKPIPLDEKAKKALGTYDEYMDLLGNKTSSRDSIAINIEELDFIAEEVAPSLEQLEDSPQIAGAEQLIPGVEAANSGQKILISVIIVWLFVLLLCLILPFFTNVV